MTIFLLVRASDALKITHVNEACKISLFNLFGDFFGDTFNQKLLAVTIFEEGVQARARKAVRFEWVRFRRRRSSEGVNGRQSNVFLFTE